MRERVDGDNLRDHGEVVDGHLLDERRRRRVQRHRDDPELRAEEQRGGVEPQHPRLHHHRHSRRAAAAAAGALLLHGHQQREPADGHRDGALGGACWRPGGVIGEEGRAQVQGEGGGEVFADEEDGGEGDEERHVHCFRFWSWGSKFGLWSGGW